MQVERFCRESVKILFVRMCTINILDGTLPQTMFLILCLFSVRTKARTSMAAKRKAEQSQLTEAIEKYNKDAITKITEVHRTEGLWPWQSSTGNYSTSCY